MRRLPSSLGHFGAGSAPPPRDERTIGRQPQRRQSDVGQSAGTSLTSINVSPLLSIGILARPAEALQLLIEHQHDPHDEQSPTEPPGEPVLPADSHHAQDESELPPNPVEPHDDHRSLSMVVPPAFDATAARPRVVLRFHLTDDALKHGHGIVRPEHGDPLTVNQLVEFLASAGCSVRVQPVLDPAGTAPIDGYEVSPRLRAAARYWQVADVFPFGTCTSPGMDLDHTQRYLPMDYGGPPGQTRFDNLGPMARSQPEPGYYLHRSPCGYLYLVTNQGTLALGRTDFSQAVWDAAQPQQSVAA